MTETVRDRHRPLKVFVSDIERAGIEMRAFAAGLSVSAYLRNLGLGYKPHSTLDQQAVLARLRRFNRLRAVESGFFSKKALINQCQHL